ncbi:MAG: UDP-2,4-diacetamido-2,4,6-trideoxy-beta-L-altropyranose hydrolase [Acidimicrobiales bacterium]
MSAANGLPADGTAAPLVVRVDSGDHIGLGHLSRCLTLADAWPGEVLFISRAFGGNGLAWLDGRHRLHRLAAPSPSPSGADGTSPWLRVPVEQDAAETLAALASQPGPAVLVVDHYGIDARWHRRLTAARPDVALVAIDDLADRPLHVDLVLDQSPQRDAAVYLPHVPPWTRVLAGSAYALLRPEFGGHRWRDGSDRLVLSLGGLDTDGNHLTVLGWLDDLRARVEGFSPEVDLPISGAAPHLSSLRDLAADRPWLHLHVDCTAMAALMAGARVAVGAPGTSALERCAVGVPGVQLVVADNQRYNAAALVRAGAAADAELADRAGFEATLIELWTDADARRQLSERARALCDGGGAARVVDELRRLEPVALVPMVASDRDLLFRWQCEPGARTYARSTEPPRPDEHAQWYAAAMRDPARRLWKVVIGDEPVGMVRLDEPDGEVSILLAAAARGRGVGVRALRALQRHTADRQLLAEIHPDNTASRRAFTNAGYRPVDATWFRLDPVTA